jgi:maltose O-acetyltransferase
MELTQKQKMPTGRLYHANDPEIQADQQSAKAWMVRYNAALGATPDGRRELDFMGILLLRGV